MKCAWKKLGRRNNTASAGLTPQLQLDRGLVEEPEPRLELELELGPELGQELVPGPLMVLVQGLGVVPVMELILRKGKKKSYVYFDFSRLLEMVLTSWKKNKKCLILPNYLFCIVCFPVKHFIHITHLEI